MHPASATSTGTAPAHRAWQLFALFLALYCLNLLIPRDLWVQDEARYGEVVREMLTLGHWLIPHLNGHFYPDKPAPYFWLVAAVGGLVGQGAMAFRLVTLASTLLALFGVYRVGRQLYGPAGGTWAAIVFATSFLTLFVGQIARMDMLLTATVALAWHGLLTFRMADRGRGLFAFWALTLLGVVVKGPIALLFTVLPALVWFLAEDGWRGLRTLRLISGLLALMAMVGLWVGLVLLQGDAHYLWQIWHNQLVGRAIHSWSHREPFYFYILLAPLLVMPWAGPVVAGLYRMYAERHPQWLSVVLFALVPMLGVSLVSGKLFIYIEPLFPALSVAGAAAVLHIHAARRPAWWVSLPPVLFLLGWAAAIAWIGRHYLAGDPLADWLAAGLVLLALTGTWLALSSGRRWLYGWTGLSIGTSILVLGLFVHLLNPLYSPRAMGEFIAAKVPPSAPIGVVNTTRGILNYYAGRLMTELDVGEAAAWWSQHPRALLIFKSQDAANLFGRRGIPTQCALDKTFSVELKTYRLLRDCPAAPH